MQPLPFRKLRQIEDLLSRVELDTLVLVFSQVEGDEYLLVYNTERLPVTTNGAWKALRLRDLRAPDYARFDGLVVGFSVVDILFSDIPTHGVNFHSLEHIFRKQGKQKQYRQNALRLAKTLFEYLEGLPESEQERLEFRGYAKAIQLALPALLETHSLENLVAVLPATDLSAFLDPKLRGFTLLYNPPTPTGSFLDISESNSPWVVAFEEMGLFHPALGRQNARFIDLRPIIRQLGAEGAMTQTRRALARRCWRDWERSGNQDFLAAAFSLAAEAWLALEDVENLVALFPNQDFERFVETGDALRVYLESRSDSNPTFLPPGPRYALEDLLDGQLTNTVYCTQALSFPALAPALKKASVYPVLDLGLALWNAGREKELARTFWLLSRDLAQRPEPEWEKVTTLALRAALIYGLSNPWQWRQGRYEDFLRKCYAHLLTCLQAQEQQTENTPLTHYYRALREWYGLKEGFRTYHLNQMVQACKAFQEQSQPCEDLQIYLETVDRLRKIGESLTLPYWETSAQRVWGTRPSRRPFEIPNYLRDIVDSQTTIRLPSPSFEQHLITFHATQARWRNEQETLDMSGPSSGVVDQFLAAYERQQRIAHLPAHESAVLRLACQENIEALTQISRTITSGSPIVIRLRNPWIVYGAPEQLSFEVENTGVAAAYQFQLELEPSPEFEILAHPAVFSQKVFTPGRPYYLKWKLQPKGVELTLNLRYRFRDHHDQQHVLSETISLPVIHLRERRGEPESIPYQAGPPVTGGRFFGRRIELKKIVTRLVGGITQPILLRGPRRMGKTSILRQLAWILDHPDEFWRLDLSPDQEFHLVTIRPVSTTLQAISPDTPNYVARFFQGIAEDIYEALQIRSKSQKMTILFDRFPVRAFMEQMDRVFERRPRERLLVIIDEWDEIYRKEYSYLGRNLRSLMDSEARINWLLSSTWTLSEEVGRYGSPFYNQAFTIEIKEMDWEAAIQLIQETGDEAGIEWHGDALVAVLEQTGRRPYLTQLLCSKLVDYLIQKASHIVDSDAVAVVSSQIIKEVKTTAEYFGFLWDGDQGKGEDIPWMRRLILWVLDAHSPEALSRAELRGAIEAELKRYALQVPNQKFFNEEFEEQMTLLQWVFDALTLEGNHYKFSVPLVRRWLHEVISQQEDLIPQAYARLFSEVYQHD